MDALPPAEAAAAVGPSRFRVSPQKVDGKLGHRAELRCEVLLTSATPGCSWLFQKNEPAARPVFLAYISQSRFRLADGLDSTRILGKRVQDTLYSLTLNSFRKEDEGYYFCSVLSNSVLYFSAFIPVFLPGPSARGATPPRCGFRAPLGTSFHTKALLSRLLEPLCVCSEGREGAYLILLPFHRRGT